MTVHFVFPIEVKGLKLHYIFGNKSPVRNKVYSAPVGSMYINISSKKVILYVKISSRKKRDGWEISCVLLEKKDVEMFKLIKKEMLAMLKWRRINDK